MIKLTPLGTKLPLVVAVAISAMLATGQTSQAAVDTKISQDAAQEANQQQNIELIGGIAQDYAARIGSGEIKLTPGNVKALAQVLATAIQAKPETGDEGPNRLANKADELVESAAIIAAQIVSNTGFAKSGTGVILNLLKGALATAKKNKALIGNSSPNLFTDLVGSVALTLIRSTGTDEKLDNKILKYLKVNALAIGGSKNLKGVKLGLKEAKANDTLANSKYEDGTLGPIIDPETDTRNG